MRSAAMPSWIVLPLLLCDTTRVEWWATVSDPNVCGAACVRTGWVSPVALGVALRSATGALRAVGSATGPPGRALLGEGPWAFLRVVTLHQLCSLETGPLPQVLIGDDVAV